MVQSSQVHPVFRREARSENDVGNCFLLYRQAVKLIEGACEWDDSLFDLAGDCAASMGGKRRVRHFNADGLWSCSVPAAFSYQGKNFDGVSFAYEG